MTESLNVIAIRRWVQAERPELMEAVDLIIMHYDDGNATHLMTLMAIGFEAGRVFQRDYPNVPFGPDAYVIDHGHSDVTA